jgi:hypothetical protein
MTAALGASFIQQCESFSPTQLQCGLTAKDLQSASACIASK